MRGTDHQRSVTYLLSHLAVNVHLHRECLHVPIGGRRRIGQALIVIVKRCRHSFCEKTVQWMWGPGHQKCVTKGEDIHFVRRQFNGCEVLITKSVTYQFNGCEVLITKKCGLPALTSCSQCLHSRTRCRRMSCYKNKPPLQTESVADGVVLVGSLCWWWRWQLWQQQQLVYCKHKLYVATGLLLPPEQAACARSESVTDLGGHSCWFTVLVVVTEMTRQLIYCIHIVCCHWFVVKMQRIVCFSKEWHVTKRTVCPVQYSWCPKIGFAVFWFQSLKFQWECSWW